MVPVTMLMSLTRLTQLDARDGARYTGFSTLDAQQGMVMEKTEVSMLQQELDVVESLPPDDQEALTDVIRHRLVEKRRAEIARNAEETLQAVRDGRAQYGSIEDLRRDLLGEP